MSYQSLIAHVPIVFIFAYCLLEMFGLKRNQKADSWFYIKATLIIVGIVLTVPTLITGGVIANQPEGQMLTSHSRLGYLTYSVFSLIAFSYLLKWMDKKYYSILECIDIWSRISNLNNKIHQLNIILFLAVIGLSGIVAFGVAQEHFADTFNQLIFEKNEHR